MNNNDFPKFRKDLRLNIVEQEGQQLIIIQDPYGFAPDNIAITYQFYVLMNTLSSGIALEQLKEDVFKSSGEIIDLQPIIEQISKLEELNLLESERFFQLKEDYEREYLSNPLRPAVCVGNSYPNEKSEIEEFCLNIFNSVDKETIAGNARSVIVPHIDLSLKGDVWQAYSSAYHSIRDTEADLYVILGTSHYANSDYYMLTRKNYNTPLGTAETDAELISLLESEAVDLFAFDEFAHKPEHSIEFQILLLQAYFKGKNFKVLPILVGSFYEYILDSLTPADNDKISEFLTQLNSAIEKLGRKAVFISSVDFAHIGRKFGDNFDAAEKLDTLKIMDSSLIENLENSDANGFFDIIRQEKDRWKVCGTAPIYSMLTARKHTSGKLLKYGIWNELPTASAVSFASIAYYD